MYLFAYLAIQTGCVVLSLNLPKHFKQFFKRSRLDRSKKIVFNLCGYALLLLGLYFCALADEFAIALTTFFGLFTVAIFVWALVLGFKKARA